MRRTGHHGGTLHEVRRQSAVPSTGALTSGPVNAGHIQLIDDVKLVILLGPRLAVPMAGLAITAPPLPPASVVVRINELGGPLHDRGFRVATMMSPFAFATGTGSGSLRPVGRVGKDVHGVTRLRTAVGTIPWNRAATRGSFVVGRRWGWPAATGLGRRVERKILLRRY